MRPPKRRTDDTWFMNRDMIEDPGSYPDDFLALPLDPDEISGLLTPERMRILRHLRDRKAVYSVSELAEVLGRDVSRVSRDLKELSEWGLVELTRNGKAKEVRRTARVIVLV